MTDRELIKLLRKAKVARDRTYVPRPEALERIHTIVAQRIDQSGVTPVGISKPWSRLVFLLGFLRSVTPPSFAYGMAVFVLLAGSAAIAAISQKALPGDTLYGAKIAVEKTQIRFTSNPASRAKVQMELAGRRLEEAQSAVSPEQEENGIRQFSHDIKEAKNTLKEAADPVQVEAVTQEFSKKAREYEEKLTETKSKKSNREVGLAAIEEAEQALKDVQEVKDPAKDKEKVVVPEQSAQEQPTKAKEVHQKDELKDGEVSL